MSGIAGIVNIDGSHIDKQQLERIARAIKDRGPDGIKIWEGGQVGLVHSHFWTTPEDIGEEQPISRGNIWLTADARIDNREELLLLLNDNLLNTNSSDAELILAAYQMWGNDCALHLIGDFAFAIWDEDLQKLYCARDPVGIRNLNYTRINDSFVFGSSVGSVIAGINSKPDINMPFIADLLAGRYQRWVDETAYLGIFRLPPAYYLTADCRGINLKRYWTFGVNTNVKFETEEEYFSYFRELFKEAVRARMRANGPVALPVSGGLDSSSIACMVNFLIHTKEIASGGRIYGGVVYDTPEADENEFLDAIVTACPTLPVTRIPIDNLWGLLEFADDNGFPLDDPETEINRCMVLNLIKCARNDGSRVILSGHGGDQVLNTDIYSSPFALSDVGLKRLFSELPYFSPFSPPHRILIPRWREIASANPIPIIPLKILEVLYRRISKHRLRGLLTSTCFEGGAQFDYLPAPRLTSRNSVMVYNEVTDGLNSAYRVTFDIYAAYTGIEWRHPFYDRRVIDFMLALPPGLGFKNGYSRYVIRKAMAGLLPEKIRLRTSKITPQPILEKGLRDKEKKRIQGLIKDSRAVEYGLVNMIQLLRAWDSYWEHDKYPIRPLVRFLCAEAWLRHYE